ncbi:MAG TPA: hypothetical protein VGC79_08050 [Polyangiaceae bacterium]
MLVRRLPTLALLAGLPFLLAHCSSDPASPGGAGAPATAGTSPVGSAGQAPVVGGGGAGGSASSVAGGGSSSVAGSSTGGSSTAGTSSGGTSTGGSSSGGANGGSSSGGSAGKAGSGTGGGPTSGSFTLTSPDLAEGAKFDTKFTCNGGSPAPGNAPNPELVWSGAPSGTMSYAITFIDTTLGDTSPMGQHWAIWNIPATVAKFPQGTKTLTGDLATAKQSAAWFPPCAQTLMNGMDDVYEFTIWAIPTATLNVSGMSVANALTALKALSPKPATATLHGHSGVKGK